MTGTISRDNRIEIPVLHENFPVGMIIMKSRDNVLFQYNPEWMSKKESFPLSVIMPFRHEIFPSDIIIPWLANFLPEEDQLRALAHNFGLSSSDPISVLMKIGGDIAGAVSIGKSSAEKNEWEYEVLTEYYNTENEEDALIAHFKELGYRPFLAGLDGVSQSLAGAQKKSALAVLAPDRTAKTGLPGPEDVLAIPKYGAPSTVIIKPDNTERLPGIVENEAYCLTLAKLCGVAAAEAAVLPAHNRSALIVARYDRFINEDGLIRRIHQEDFAQANGVFPNMKYEIGKWAGLDLRDIFKAGKYLSATDLLDLCDQVIFNLLVANSDAHAKNYSLLLTDNVKMAPLYDVSTVLFWPHLNQYHAQKLAGKKRKSANLAGRHWNRIAEDNGFSGNVLRERVQELLDAMVVNRMEAVGIISGMKGVIPEMVEHIAEIIEKNALRIGGRLFSEPGYDDLNISL